METVITTTKTAGIECFIHDINALFITCGFKPKHEEKPSSNSTETRMDFILEGIPKGLQYKEYVLKPIKPFLQVEGNSLTEITDGFAFHYREYLMMISVTVTSYQNPILSLTFWIDIQN